MRRKLFNMVSVVSLLLFMATVGLWARSYYVCDALSRTRLAPDGSPRVVTVVFASDTGQLSYQRMTRGGGLAHWPAAEAQARVHGWMRETTKPRVRDHAWWPRKHHIAVALSSTAIGVGYIMPLWIVTLLLALPGICVASQWALRRRRHQHNLCVDCGYDLRATPDRCPECGAVGTRAA